MLFAMFIDREAFEVDVPAGPELWLNRARNIDGRLQTQIRHAVFDDFEVDGYDARHFNSAAKGDFAIPL
jgi:hypothetical protein